MAFRDDLEAAHARSEALEQRVAELEAENARLRRGPDEPAVAPGSRERLPGGLMITLIIGAFLCPFVFIFLLPTGWGIVIGLAAFALLIGISFALDTLVAIAAPGEFLVLSGQRYRAPDGRVLNYRIVPAGRVLRVPIVERLERMSTKPMEVELAVDNAYAGDGAPVSVQLRASVRVAVTRPLVDNAIERFLGRSADEIATVARQTLEGAVRIVVAARSVAEMRQQPDAFADQVIEEASGDMNKLGLELETLSLIGVRESR